MHNLPRPLPQNWEPPVRILFTDVDDTLTWQGQLPVEAFIALEKLRSAGIRVVPVTGASAGWCDCIIRTWPINDIIGENGSFWMKQASDKSVIRHFRDNQQTRKLNNDRLHKVGTEVLARFPGIDYTQDQPFRLTDMAFDIAQQASVPREVAKAATQWLIEQGINARLSSIHLNIWLGSHNKADSALRWLESEGADIEPNQCIFIGDSPNDETMFEHFPESVGVANIHHFLNEMKYRPKYITKQMGGLGFAELADLITII
jgi:HAD superfamily hydrolase (TIGR01484 family)